MRALGEARLQPRMLTDLGFRTEANRFFSKAWFEFTIVATCGVAITSE